MKPWTTRELTYLCTNANDGAERLASALGRTPGSIRAKAYEYGISLKPREICPRCGLATHKPLHPLTGFCACCSRELRLIQIREEVLEIEEETRRLERVEREIQALYSRKNKSLKRRNEIDTK